MHVKFFLLACTNYILMLQFKKRLKHSDLAIFTETASSLTSEFATPWVYPGQSLPGTELEK